MDSSTNLQMPYLMPSQAQKHVTVNESLRRLDGLVQASAVSRSISEQPADPADGAIYLLPAGKTGAAWDGFADGAAGLRGCGHSLGRAVLSFSLLQLKIGARRSPATDEPAVSDVRRGGEERELAASWLRRRRGAE